MDPLAGAREQQREQPHAAAVVEMQLRAAVVERPDVAGAPHVACPPARAGGGAGAACGAAAGGARRGGRPRRAPREALAQPRDVLEHDA